MLDLPTHLLQFDTNCGKIRYVVSDSKTNRSSFCLISKLSHALAEKVGLRKLTSWMFCSVCYLGFMVVNINALFAEWRITERDYFHILLLGIFSGTEPTIFSFGYRFCGRHFPCFCKYIFPHLQTCSADCTEGSCSSNTTSNF